MRRTLKTTLAIVASAAAVSLGAAPASAAVHRAAVRRAADVGPAYFEMTDSTHRMFVIEVADPAEIRHARALVRGGTRNEPHVVGRIMKLPTFYNRPWNYHLHPDTIKFFDRPREACDATIPFVEHHLDQAGGAVLPGLVWCDRTSRLVREVPAP